MRATAMMVGIVGCCGLAACGPAGGKSLDSNLECSALISAATYIVRDGKAEKDPLLTRRGLVSLMTYLNTYAIPKRMKEADAFKELHGVRATMMETLEPGDIMRRAKRCMDRSPA